MKKIKKINKKLGWASVAMDLKGTVYGSTGLG
jgi:hypothetical protein